MVILNHFNIYESYSRLAGDDLINFYNYIRSAEINGSLLEDIPALVAPETSVVVTVTDAYSMEEVLVSTTTQTIVNPNYDADKIHQ